MTKREFIDHAMFAAIDGPGIELRDATITEPLRVVLQQPSYGRVLFRWNPLTIIGCTILVGITVEAL